MPPFIQVAPDGYDFLFDHAGAPQLDWLDARIGACPGDTIEVVFKE